MLVVTHSLPTLSELLLVSVFDASVRSDAQRDETGAKVGNGCVTHFTVAAIGRPEPAPCEYGPLDCKCGDTDQSVRARAGLDVYDTARLFTVRLDERRYASRKRATYPRARPPGDP